MELDKIGYKRTFCVCETCVCLEKDGRTKQ